MLSVISKWFLAVGFGFAAAITGVTDTSLPAASDTVPVDNNPITASELSTSLHDRITDLRGEIEREKLNDALPLVRPFVLGHKGDDVKALQELLVGLNFMSEDLATGYYGPTTASAVKEFQKAYQMNETGIADRTTLDKIFDITVATMHLGDAYFPEESPLLAIATSSEALLSDASASADASAACPDVSQTSYQAPADTVVDAPVIVPPATTTVATTTPPVTKTLAVAGANFAFTPKTLSVTKDTIVTIHFTVTTGSHTFVIDAYKVKSATTTSAKANDVTFTATSTGSFVFYSSVATDKQSGMTGTLTVTN
ncbi:MAG: peptidase [Parcubacteria group bacterium]|nr:peptidase [Parcubacteria group bacterium]